MTIEDIINRITYARKQINLSARELSNKLNKNNNYIHTIENGKASPNLKTLLKIIEICGMTCEQFFYNDITNYTKDIILLNKIKQLNAVKAQALSDLLDYILKNN